jgi:hypothetical protein
LKGRGDKGSGGTTKKKGEKTKRKNKETTKTLS